MLKSLLSSPLVIIFSLNVFVRLLEAKRPRVLDWMAKLLSFGGHFPKPNGSTNEFLEGLIIRESAPWDDMGIVRSRVNEHMCGCTVDVFHAGPFGSGPGCVGSAHQPSWRYFKGLNAKKQFGVRSFSHVPADQPLLNSFLKNQTEGHDQSQRNNPS